MTAIGETIQLIAMLFDMENREIPGTELTWTSEDTTVATVSNQGVVTGAYERKNACDGNLGRRVHQRDSHR